MRIRLNDETVRLLEAAAEPGEAPQDTLKRVLEIRDHAVTYKGMSLSYAELAERWQCSVSLVKHRVGQYRRSGGNVGLGPVVKLGARKVLVPLRAVVEYEKAGVF
jgi:hypothetical protein